MDSAAVTQHLNTAAAAIAANALANEATNSLLKTLTSQPEIRTQLTKSQLGYIIGSTSHGIRFTHCEISRRLPPVESALRQYTFDRLVEDLKPTGPQIPTVTAGFTGAELRRFLPYGNFKHIVSRTPENIEMLLTRAASKGRSITSVFESDPLSSVQKMVSGDSEERCPTGYRLVVAPEYALKIGVPGVLRLMHMVKATVCHVFLPIPFEVQADVAKCEHYDYEEYEVNGDTFSYLNHINCEDPVPLWLLLNEKGHAFQHCTMPGFHRFWKNGCYKMASMIPQAPQVPVNTKYTSILGLWRQWLVAYSGAAVSNQGVIYTTRGEECSGHWFRLSMYYTEANHMNMRSIVTIPEHRRCYRVRDLATGYAASGRASGRYFPRKMVWHKIPCSVVEDMRGFMGRHDDSSYADTPKAFAMLHSALRKTIATLTITAGMKSEDGPYITNAQVDSLLVALLVEQYIKRARMNLIVGHEKTPGFLKNLQGCFAEAVFDSNPIGEFVLKAIYGNTSAPLHLIEPAEFKFIYEFPVWVEVSFGRTTIYDDDDDETYEEDEDGKSVWSSDASSESREKASIKELDDDIAELPDLDDSNSEEEEPLSRSAGRSDSPSSSESSSVIDSLVSNLNANPAGPDSKLWVTDWNKPDAYPLSNSALKQIPEASAPPIGSPDMSITAQARLKMRRKRSFAWKKVEGPKPEPRMVSTLEEVDKAIEEASKEVENSSNPDPPPKPQPVPQPRPDPKPKKPNRPSKLDPAKGKEQEEHDQVEPAHTEEELEELELSRAPQWAKDYIATCPKKYKAKYDPSREAVVFRKAAHQHEKLVTRPLTHIKPAMIDEVNTSWGPPEMQTTKQPVTGALDNPPILNVTAQAKTLRKFMPGVGLMAGITARKWENQHRNCHATHDKKFPNLCKIGWTHSGAWMQCNRKIPQMVDFSIPAAEVAKFIGVLQKSKNPLDQKMANFVASKTVADKGFVCPPVKVCIVEAPPGCGKTFLISCLAKEAAYRGQGYHICVPLSNLSGDYGQASIPSPSGTATILLSKGTQLYWAVKNFNTEKPQARSMVDVLIVDEAWMAAGEHLSLAICVLRPKILYLIGDSYQNELPSNVIIRSLASFLPRKSVQGDSKHCIHRLVMNFRNPPTIVNMLNKHYYSHSPMIAMSKEKGHISAHFAPDGDEPYSPRYTDSAGNPEPYYTMYCSDKTGEEMASEITADIAINNAGSTVLSSQGLTRKCVKVYFTNRDIAATRQLPLMRVMLSRHTHELVFVLDQQHNRAQLILFLSTLGIGVEIQHRLMRQQVPTTDLRYAKVELEPEHKAERPAKSDFNAFEVLESGNKPDPDEPHANSKGRLAPIDKPIRKFQLDPDATKSETVLQNYQEAYQLAAVPNVLMQTSAGLEAARTALTRYNQAVSKQVVGPAEMKIIDDAIAYTWTATKDENKLRAMWADVELQATLFDKYIADNKERYTFQKADGFASVDSYAQWVRHRPGFSVMDSMREVVYMRQKQGIKAINNTKDFSTEKAGQGVSNFNPMFTLSYGFMMRFVNHLDMNSNYNADDAVANRTSPLQWNVIEHNGRQPELVAEDLARVFRSRSDEVQLVIGDLPQADSSIGAAEYYLSKQWDKKCCPPNPEWLMMLDEFYDYLPHNTVVVPQMIKFVTDCENLSGHSATLRVTSNTSKVVVTNEFKDSQGNKVYTGVGDDDMVMATVIKRNGFIDAWGKFSRVRLNVADARKQACDFVGHTIFLEGKELVMVPSLIRRYRRMCAKPWKDAKQFLATKQAILDYFKAYDNLEWRPRILSIAANLLAWDDGRDPSTIEMKPYFDLADMIWSAFESMSHWSAEDFYRNATKVRVPVGVPF